MKPFPLSFTDPVFSKPVSYSRTDRFILSCLRDERDLPFIYFLLKILLILIPAAVLLFTPLLGGWQWWLAAVTYMLTNAVFFIGRFALLFHCAAHRTLFRKNVGFLNYLLPYLFAPFFGHMAETYHAHHVGMHHAENNLQDDESSTMPYQRDSVVDFVKYLMRFILTGIYQLAGYFKKRNRKKLMHNAVQGQVLIVLLCIVLCCLNWRAALCVFIFPYFFYRLIAMMGNWAQHAFIDRKDPGNAYKNSITCINSNYNWQCWNDGYHISHHLKQTMHWSEHPANFQMTAKEYGLQNAVVFSRIDFMLVSVFLLAKRYDLLAKNFINIGDRFQSDEEVILFLKERTQRFAFEI